MNIGACLSLSTGIEDLRQIIADLYKDILKFHSRTLAFFKQRSDF